MSFQLPKPPNITRLLNDKVEEKLNDIRRIAGQFRLIPSLEPQRAYMFEVAVLGGEQEPNIKFFLKNAVIPSSSREPIILDYLDTRVVFPGKYTGSRSVTLTFWDDERLTMFRYFNRWLTATENKRIKSNYSRDLVISLKDTSDFIETARITLKNAFVTEVADVNLSYESGEIMELSVTFAYEYKEINEEASLKFDPLELIR